MTDAPDLPDRASDEATDVPGHVLVHSGKVRDLYAPIDDGTGLPREDQLLLVASDRISAFDHVLATPIPDKGEVLTRMSLWWFEQLAQIVPNQSISTEVPEQVRGRACYVRRLRMLPVECIGRAYLTGGGLAEYREHGTVSGVPLPEGLVDGSALSEPVFTPTTKAPAGEHDQPMTFTEVERALGATVAARARDLTLAILSRANEIAAERGILLADTKLEFGRLPRGDQSDPFDRSGATGHADALDELGERLDHGGEGQADEDTALFLADEALTPDSSRFWRADEWEPGRPQTSFDKQFVRDWLTSPDSGWDPGSGQAPPPLPDHVVEGTRAKYIEAFESLTGQRFR